MKLTTLPATRLNIVVSKKAKLNKPVSIRLAHLLIRRPLPQIFKPCELQETRCEDAIQSNAEAVKHFFKTFDESSMIEFSIMMLDYMKLSWENEMNCAEKTDEEMELQIFKIKELNRFLLKLKDPTQLIATA